jgi:hypothetical protein
MREDRLHGCSDPASRRATIKAATTLYCPICKSRPCELLTAAALNAMHERYTRNVTDKLTDPISAMLYAQSLERLHDSFISHVEAFRKAWQLDDHSQTSESSNGLEEQSFEMESLRPILHLRTKDPPNLKLTC